METRRSLHRNADTHKCRSMAPRRKHHSPHLDGVVLRKRHGRAATEPRCPLRQRVAVVASGQKRHAMLLATSHVLCHGACRDGGGAMHEVGILDRASRVREPPRGQARSISRDARRPWWSQRTRAAQRDQTQQWTRARRRNCNQSMTVMRCIALSQ